MATMVLIRSTNLEPGTYNVTADASGFQTVNIEAVQVETNSRLPLDVKFTSITGGAGSVTITADSAPLVESETSARGRDHRQTGY